MSTELYSDGDLHITSFAGGKGRGACVQISTTIDFYVQLDRIQAETTCKVLASWLGLETLREGKRE